MTNVHMAMSVKHPPSGISLLRAIVLYHLGRTPSNPNKEKEQGPDEVCENVTRVEKSIGFVVP